MANREKMMTISDRPFIDPAHKPTDQDLQAGLGKTYVLFKEIHKITPAYNQEWNYSKNSGWMFKVFDRKKALFYVIPLESSFKISLTIRENERIRFLEDEGLEAIHKKILASKKFSEGYAIAFEILDVEVFSIVELFLKKLIELRDKGWKWR